MAKKKSRYDLEIVSKRLSAIPGTPQYKKRLRERNRYPQLTVRVPRSVYRMVRKATTKKDICISKWLRRAILAYLTDGGK